MGSPRLNGRGCRAVGWLLVLVALALASQLAAAESAEARLRHRLKLDDLLLGGDAGIGGAGKIGGSSGARGSTSSSSNSSASGISSSSSSSPPTSSSKIRESADVAGPSAADAAAAVAALARVLPLDNASAAAAPCWNALEDATLSRLAAGEWNESALGPLAGASLSRNTCRRAVTNHGDERMLDVLARRLLGGQCLNVVVLGGSIGCLLPAQAAIESERLARWPLRLMALLDAAWPCPGGHHLSNLCKSATGSPQAFQVLQRHANHETLAKAHLVLVDKAINDVVSGPMVSSAWNLDSTQQKKFTTAFWTEAIVRRARTLYPQAAIVYLETSWEEWCFVRQLPPSTEWTVEKPRPRPPFHTDGARDHLSVLEYYDVAQIDLARMLGPIRGGRVGPRGQFLQTWFFRNDCVHHTAVGASITAAVVAEYLANAARAINNNHALHAWMPFENAVPAETLVLEPQDLAFAMSTAALDLNFELPHVAHQAVAFNDGNWTFATDRPGKPAMLTTNTTGACVAVALLNAAFTSSNEETTKRLDRPLALLWVEMIASYQGFGVAQATIVQETVCGHVAQLRANKATTLKQDASDVDVQGFMPTWNETQFEVLARGTFDCNWADPSSQTRPFLLRLEPVQRAKQRQGCATLLRLCQVEPNPDRKKLKLATVTAFTFEQ